MCIIQGTLLQYKQFITAVYKPSKLVYEKVRNVFIKVTCFTCKKVTHSISDILRKFSFYYHSSDFA